MQKNAAPHTQLEGFLISLDATAGSEESSQASTPSPVTLLTQTCFSIKYLVSLKVINIYHVLYPSSSN